MHVNLRTGYVSWASDWPRMDDLVEQGYARREPRGITVYGGHDYFLSKDVLDKRLNML